MRRKYYLLNLCFKNLSKAKNILRNYEISFAILLCSKKWSISFFEVWAFFLAKFDLFGLAALCALCERTINNPHSDSVVTVNCFFAIFVVIYSTSSAQVQLAELKYK